MRLFRTLTVNSNRLCLQDKYCTTLGLLFKAEKTYKLIKERPIGKESTNFNCVSLGLHSLQKQSRSQAEKIKTCFFTKTNNKSRFTKSATVVITIDELKQFFLDLFFCLRGRIPSLP